MNNELLEWIAERLSGIMRSYRNKHHHMDVSRKFMNDFVDKVDLLSIEEREDLIKKLDTWIKTSVVGESDFSKDKDEATILEGLLGTMIGIIEG